MSEQGTTEDIENLPLGVYLVKETISSKGYLIDKNEYIVNLEYEDQNTQIISKTVTSYEVVKKMQVHIFKSGIKELSGQVTGIEGVGFDIKLASDVEKAYELGYSYEEVWYSILEGRSTSDIDITRVIQAQEIAPTYDRVFTDENGDAYTIALPYGKYIGKEIITPEDYETADDFYFSITEDESEIVEIAKKVKHIYINNEQLETYIKLVKKDKETGKVVTSSSTTFKIVATENIYDRGTGKILYEKGEIITQKVGSKIYSTFTTNSESLIVPAGSYANTDEELGTVVTPLKLEVRKLCNLGIVRTRRLFNARRTNRI